MYRREYDMRVVGRNLKRLREAKNLSVDEVRRYLRLGSVQAVYKYERGQSYPQADTMFALMELYDASLYDIVNATEEDLVSSSVVICWHLGIYTNDGENVLLRNYCGNCNGTRAYKINDYSISGTVMTLNL